MEKISSHTDSQQISELGCFVILNGKYRSAFVSNSNEIIASNIIMRVLIICEIIRMTGFGDGSSSNETFRNSKTCTKHKKISRLSIITFNLLQHEMTDPFHKNYAYSSSKYLCTESKTVKHRLDFFLIKLDDSICRQSRSVTKLFRIESNC